MPDNYYSCRVENGSINISEDVISGIVCNAVTEVEGVAGLANIAGAELSGRKMIAKGIKVSFDDEKIRVDAIITVLYGCNIVSVAKKAQEAISNSLSSSAGIVSAEVNIHVAGISFEK